MTRAEDVLKEFEISLFSLKFKVHSFEYQIGKKFFDCFENSPLEEGEFEIEVSLDKSETLLQLEFFINGKAKLVCDRSLDEFDYSLSKTSRMVYKYGEEYEEMSEELIVIPEGTQILNIASVIYELIALEIPFKKLHPRFEEEEDDEELEAVYIDEEIEEEETEIEEQIDSTWEDLKKKFNK